MPRKPAKPKRRDPSDTKRARALDLVAAGRSSIEVAAELGIARQTVARWRRDPDFDEQLRERQAELSNEVHAALVARSFEVARALGDIALDHNPKKPEEPAGHPAMARVHAARTYFELLGKHKNAPVAPAQNAGELETEEDVLAALRGIPPRLLEEALQEARKPKKERAL